MKVTVGLKALNEERHIADALASAVKAAQPFGGEVILADSGSTDRTLDIARSYPVKIVQLADPAQRSCGAGAQLAFQQAEGDYFYLLDGDMVLHPEFLPAAVAFLDQNPDFAAVGGRVREVNTNAMEFQIRARTVANNRNWLPGVVDRLDCGGLYRASAIRQVGYFADRNLHAFEEFELAARLQSRGWKLARIDKPAIDHFGHQSEGYKLMWRRMVSGYSGASGEVLRGALGHPHLPIVLRRLGHIRNGLAVMLWWLSVIVSLVLPLPAHWWLGIVLALVLGPAGLLIVRRRSVKLGFYSFVQWNVSAWGLLTGFVRRRISPLVPLAAVILPSSNNPDKTQAPSPDLSQTAQR